MNGTIHVPANRVWGYFKRYEAELLTSLHKIAEWDECGITVYLTAEADYPCFQVLADDTVVDEVVAADADECEMAADEIYDTYLTQNLFGKMEDLEKGGKEEEISEAEGFAYEREEAIDYALVDFLEIVLDGGELPENRAALDPDDELFHEIKEHFLEYLACDIGYQIYRPTICKDEDGNETIVEFPYLMYRDDVGS